MDQLNGNGSKKQPVHDWNNQQAKLLQNWAEIASCYRWLHNRSHLSYKKQNMRFMIPLIIMSTITGTANFAQNTFPTVIRPYIPAIIGAVNLFCAILTTLYQFLKISENMEAHRITSINFGKYSRNITVELSLPVKDRSIGGKELVKISRTEIDRLIEQSPTIPKIILDAFNNEYSNSGITEPEIIHINKVDIYTDDEYKNSKIIADAGVKFKNIMSERVSNRKNYFTRESMGFTGAVGNKVVRAVSGGISDIIKRISPNTSPKKQSFDDEIVLESVITQVPITERIEQVVKDNLPVSKLKQLGVKIDNEMLQNARNKLRNSSIIGDVDENDEFHDPN